jgi:chromosome segregation ATPase
MSAASSASLQQRISEQLQALSQVGETLTLRLLELEERLASLEQQIGDLGTNQANDPANLESSEILAHTEERIARLEELLNEQHHSAAVHPFPPRSEERRQPPGTSTEKPELELELNPFPDEEEQPFMDELSA